MSRAPIFVKPERGRLVPGDSYAQQQIDELPSGDYFARVSRITRAGKDERDGLRGLWWAGLNLLAKNTDDPEFDTARKAHETILRGLGYVYPLFKRDGSFTLEPMSTKDEFMSDEDFIILMERARVWLAERVGFDPIQQWSDEQDAARAANTRGFR